MPLNISGVFLFADGLGLRLKNEYDDMLLSSLHLLPRLSQGDCVFEQYNTFGGICSALSEGTRESMRRSFWGIEGC